MRIAHCVELFPKLSETFIHRQLTGLLEAGHEIHIFADRPAEDDKHHPGIVHYELLEATTYTYPAQNYIAALLDTVATFPRAPIEVSRSLARGPAGARRVANLQTAARTDFSKFDAIHAHFGTVGNSWDFLPKQLLPETPFIVSFYGEDASAVIEDDATVYNRLFDTADVVTALSQDMETTLINAGCPSDIITRHHLPVDTDAFEYQPRSLPADGPIRVTTIARFQKKKGIQYAVDAITMLLDDHNIRYSIAGDGPLYSEIQNRIHDHGIEHAVELTGWLNTDEIIELLQDTHIFVLPSVTTDSGEMEGTPTVLLEAQAMGIPVVSTCHAGIPEIVADRESGLLVPERDVDALAGAIEDLITHPEWWGEMGRYGRRQIVEEYSIPAIVGRLEEIYKSGKDS